MVNVDKDDDPPQPVDLDSVSVAPSALSAPWATCGALAAASSSSEQQFACKATQGDKEPPSAPSMFAGGPGGPPSMFAGGPGGPGGSSSVGPVGGSSSAGLGPPHRRALTLQLQGQPRSPLSVAVRVKVYNVTDFTRKPHELHLLHDGTVVVSGQDLPHGSWTYRAWSFKWPHVPEFTIEWNCKSDANNTRTHTYRGFQGAGGVFGMTTVSPEWNSVLLVMPDCHY